MQVFDKEIFKKFHSIKMLNHPPTYRISQSGKINLLYKIISFFSMKYWICIILMDKDEYMLQSDGGQINRYNR